MTVVTLLYPLSGAILWGMLFILIKNTKVPVIYGIGIGFLGGILSLSLPTFLFSVPNFLSIIDPKILLILATVGISRYILGTWFFFESIRVGEVSVATPIVGSKTIIVSILAVILGIEKVNFLLLTAILLATIGFVSITLHIGKLDKFHKKDLIKCVALALATSLCWSVADIFVTKIKYVHPFIITFGSLFFAALLYFAFILFFKKNQMVFNMSGFDKKRYFLYGVFSLALTYLLLNLSLVKIGIIKTNIIISLWPLIASLVGYSWYKEKLFFSKVFGAIMLIISFILVALS